MTTEHVDVMIIGAGLSGIAAAYYLQTRCPGKRYVILEARDGIGGTWDLFRYPGVRSDSDMHTLGYSFRPWREAKAIADGPAILKYVRETAAEFGIDRNIRFSHRLRRASWSSEYACWTLDVEQGAARAPLQLTCSFLYTCTGYYEYEHGHTPFWPAVEGFGGQIIHPQQWPTDVDYTNKRVVVIGSGATAVTLVPALAERASHVTMLQRSPTYIVSRPAEDPVANWLHRHLPSTIAPPLIRWKNILLGMYFYALARRKPAKVKQAIVQMARAQLGPDYDVDTHFSPLYNPWDQRLCLVPEGDLFKAITAGKASVVTDHIETFTSTGIRLNSGAELPADIIVTATGLSMRLMSGVELHVDGKPVELAETVSYRGVMYSGVPNLASSIGYVNASWTLKCELIARYVCRLLNYMDAHGYAVAAPQHASSAVSEEPVLNLTSGYIQRARSTLPRQGMSAPWRVYQNYLRDLVNFRLQPINDGTLQFAPPPVSRRGKPALPALSRASIVTKKQDASLTTNRA